MPVNTDFRDLFAALNEANARYLLVGGYGRHLIQNKRASGRPQDLLDVTLLER